MTITAAGDRAGDQAEQQDGQQDGQQTQQKDSHGGGPGGRQLGVILGVLVLLFGFPCWTLFGAGSGWPVAARAAGIAAFAAAALGLPVLMVAGHGRRQRDAAAVTGDTLLGIVWVLFAWSIPGGALHLVLLGTGVAARPAGRISAVAVAGVAALLIAYGIREAMRVPRIKRVEVRLERLGAGLDGVTVAVLTDTHYGPIDRARWSARVVEAVNALAPDIVCHTGDIADGSVARRTAQAAPLARVRARLARAYVTGNHEYFGEPQGWLDHMRTLGWEPLHNRHVVVESGGDRLVVAGVDDRTAAGWAARGSGRDGHGADHAAALQGADPALPVLLLAHQPAQVSRAAEHGIDLQVSGHTHGGQIWPFHYLVRIDQPAVAGLSRHGSTQLYTSRGTGFWGPPLRIFAPSEITLLTLRAERRPAS